MNYRDWFKVQPGSEVKLKDIEPSFKDRHVSHKEATKEIEQQGQSLEVKVTFAHQRENTRVRG